MYMIYTADGRSLRTDEPVYIKPFTADAFLVTDERHAEGVCYHGEPLWFADGNSIAKTDGGADMDRMESTGKAVSADQDDLLVDQEYRLTMLELGL